MKGLFHTAVAAVIALALITVPASSVKADTANEWIPQLSNVLDLVYCIIGTGSCEGLEPGSDLVTPEDGITQEDVDAAVAAAMPDCDFGGGQVWDGSTCATPESADPELDCFLMGFCGVDGGSNIGLGGPYNGVSYADASEVGGNCASDYSVGLGFYSEAIFEPSGHYPDMEHASFILFHTCNERRTYSATP